ncbi:type II toxin-antitoxin system VapC family toxin [Candidatus Venteria ishoeyi]|uniref:PIN domain-containing protein n=1 Tax=Candidatus Venteria ishoeyi TaxID=1899563 RepID=A0A1H6FD48_9GAMM|nr:type II toxin-antitoxin system VapC family toxin [Candidatus Venteria ishoeyi]SEH08002.1 Uncharacterised protein [Candidatus Venteria ishoeyi]
MIGLDTNVLARYYIQDESDEEAQKQHEIARYLIMSGKPLMVCKTVILELEWVMRGYYDFNCTEIATVFRHLLSLSHIVVEDKAGVAQAVFACEQGLDFADALHHTGYQDCTEMVSFDDRKFIRHATRLGLEPPVNKLEDYK